LTACGVSTRLVLTAFAVMLAACATVDVSTAPTIVGVEQKLCKAAGKLGADAVVVVYDRVQPVAAYVSGPWWSRSVETISGRKVVAVAVRYQR
jgi:hypothetical protein